MIAVDGAGVSVSPLSSATTVFQTATNGGSGSAVNDGYPLEAGPGTTTGTMTNCPHSYPQAVDRTSRRRSVVYRRGCRGPGLVTAMLRSVGSRPTGHPRFVVWSPFRFETALPEANSFISGANRSATLHGGSFAGAWQSVTAVAAVNCSMRRAGRGLTQRNLVSTLEQSPERGDTAATRDLLWRPRRLASETDELTNGDRVPHWH